MKQTDGAVRHDVDRRTHHRMEEHPRSNSKGGLVVCWCSSTTLVYTSHVSTAAHIIHLHNSECIEWEHPDIHVLCIRICSYFSPRWLLPPVSRMACNLCRMPLVPWPVASVPHAVSFASSSSNTLWILFVLNLGESTYTTCRLFFLTLYRNFGGFTNDKLCKTGVSMRYFCAVNQLVCSRL